MSTDHLIAQLLAAGDAAAEGASAAEGVVAGASPDETARHGASPSHVASGSTHAPATTDATRASFDALRTLLDDSTVESPDDPAAEPKSIADAARLLGLSTSTLRYYERQGLVVPQRDATGHRRYAPEHMRRLVFCTRMRLSGMSMGDLTQYIALVEAGDATIEQRRALMLAHREKIVRRQRELELALAATDYKIATYSGHPHE